MNDKDDFDPIDISDIMFEPWQVKLLEKLREWFPKKSEEEK